jgi:hypothetical protein
MWWSLRSLSPGSSVGVFSGVALASTSTDAIILDFQQHGKLTGTYAVAELDVYLNDAAAHQYLGAEQAVALDALVRAQIAAQTAAATSTRQTFPFTGTELFAGLGAAAVLIGAAPSVFRGHSSVARLLAGASGV